MRLAPGIFEMRKGRASTCRVGGNRRAAPSLIAAGFAAHLEMTV